MEIIVFQNKYGKTKGDMMRTREEIEKDIEKYCLVDAVIITEVLLDIRDLNKQILKRLQYSK